MAFTRVLHMTALFLLQGDFPSAGSETITLKEGEDLNLHCTLSSHDSSARQWLNPHGFAIFLNTQRALRDQRYKLIHYSKDELSIQLSNVTVHDEGVYKCFYYGIPFKSKSKTVEVLAAPSNPVLEVSQDAKRSITLSCYTQGCKPQPQITWLLDNRIELLGDTKHKLEADGKKWTTTSTLTVLAYGSNSTASCIIHHQALREEKLMASLRFEELPRTATKTNPALEVNTHVSQNKQSTVTAAVSDLNGSTAPTPSYPQHTGSEQPTVPSAVPEDPVVTSSASTTTQQNLQPDVTPPWSKVTPAASGKEALAGSLSYHVPNRTETAFNGNVTEEEISRTEAPLPSDNVTEISIITFDQDLKSEGIKKKENNLLLPILVAALIFALLIIVLLFIRKLKKAHGVWKRENDVSEQTLESYKSKSNEDSPGHEKNGYAVNQKSNMQYVTGYVETTQKNPRDKNIAISEKLFGCGKETDV
ncbi:PREDICTED: cytotoxic and regulatory T-cell molecule [Leptosomus discolor]|uniref:cytotoxic and regulatory T-cell molecule n=1 Tax=Leptosomus discolor TaxID=188344 RepID=UPI0005223D53|nr:PREDICTED: cytotoxic and regulatory T-cell molecule [Leptosomus discolor]